MNVEHLCWIPILTGCGGDGASAPASTIVIDTLNPPALVAFRDVADETWQPLRGLGPTAFEAEVHGPYTVTIVCADGAAIVTTQFARTPEDDRAISAPCGGTGRPIQFARGVMQQAGKVLLGDDVEESSTPAWSYELVAPLGTYDLVALAGDRIAIRRGVAVAGDTVITPAIDLATEGTPLVDTIPVATNAAADEVVEATVALAGERLPARPLYVGPAAGTVLAPDAVLDPQDRQLVGVRATGTGTVRSVERAFRAGDDPAFALPDLVGPFGVDAGADLTVTWSTLPDVGELAVTLDGTPQSELSFHFQAKLLSRRFVDATAAIGATLETDIPGFLPEWRIDLSRVHVRGIDVTRREVDTATLSSRNELVGQ